MSDAGGLANLEVNIDVERAKQQIAELFGAVGAGEEALGGAGAPVHPQVAKAASGANAAHSRAHAALKKQQTDFEKQIATHGPGIYGSGIAGKAGRQASEGKSDAEIQRSVSSGKGALTKALTKVYGDAGIDSVKAITGKLFPQIDKAVKDSVERVRRAAAHPPEIRTLKSGEQAIFQRDNGRRIAGPFPATFNASKALEDYKRGAPLPPPYRPITETASKPVSRAASGGRAAGGTAPTAPLGLAASRINRELYQQKISIDNSAYGGTGTANAVTGTGPVSGGTPTEVKVKAQQEGAAVGKAAVTEAAKVQPKQPSGAAERAAKRQVLGLPATATGEEPTFVPGTPKDEQRTEAQRKAAARSENNRRRRLNAEGGIGNKPYGPVLEFPEQYEFPIGPVEPLTDAQRRAQFPEQYGHPIGPEAPLTDAQRRARFSAQYERPIGPKLTDLYSPINKRGGVGNLPYGPPAPQQEVLVRSQAAIGPILDALGERFAKASEQVALFSEALRDGVLQEKEAFGSLLESHGLHLQAIANKGTFFASTQGTTEFPFASTAGEAAQAVSARTILTQTLKLRRQLGLSETSEELSAVGNLPEGDLRSLHDILANRVAGQRRLGAAQGVSDADLHTQAQIQAIRYVQKTEVVNPYTQQAVQDLTGQKPTFFQRARYSTLSPGARPAEGPLGVQTGLQFAGQHATNTLGYLLPGIAFGVGIEELSKAIQEATQAQEALAILKNEFTSLGQAGQFSGFSNSVESIADKTGVAVGEVAQLALAMTGVYGVGKQATLAIQGVAQATVTLDLTAQEAQQDMTALAQGFTDLQKQGGSAMTTIQNLLLNLQYHTGVKANDLLAGVSTVASTAQSVGFNSTQTASIVAAAAQHSGLSSETIGETFSKLIEAIPQSIPQFYQAFLQTPSLAKQPAYQNILSDPLSKQIQLVLAGVNSITSPSEKTLLLSQLGINSSALPAANALFQTGAEATRLSQLPTPPNLAANQFAAQIQTLPVALERMQQAFVNLGVEIVNSPLGHDIAGLLGLIASVAEGFEAIGKSLGGFGDDLVNGALAVAAASAVYKISKVALGALNIQIGTNTGAFAEDSAAVGGNAVAQGLHFQGAGGAAAVAAEGGALTVGGVGAGVGEAELGANVAKLGAVGELAPGFASTVLASKFAPIAEGIGGALLLGSAYNQAQKTKQNQIGSNFGILGKDVAGGALAGAAIGSVVPVVGTIGGAIAGAGLGALTAGLEIVFENSLTNPGLALQKAASDLEKAATAQPKSVESLQQQLIKHYESQGASPSQAKATALAQLQTYGQYTKGELQQLGITQGQASAAQKAGINIPEHVVYKDGKAYVETPGFIKGANLNQGGPLLPGERPPVASPTAGLTPVSAYVNRALAAAAAKQEKQTPNFSDFGQLPAYELRQFGIGKGGPSVKQLEKLGIKVPTNVAPSPEGGGRLEALAPAGATNGKFSADLIKIESVRQYLEGEIKTREQQIKAAAKKRAEAIAKTAATVGSLYSNWSDIQTLFQAGGTSAQAMITALDKDVTALQQLEQGTPSSQNYANWVNALQTRNQALDQLVSQNQQINQSLVQAGSATAEGALLLQEATPNNPLYLGAITTPGVASGAVTSYLSGLQTELQNRAAAASTRSQQLAIYKQGQTLTPAQAATLSQGAITAGLGAASGTAYGPPGATTYGNTVTGYTYGGTQAGASAQSSQFSLAVLKALGITPTPAALRALNAQQTAEGQWGAGGTWNAGYNNNPFNIEAGGNVQWANSTNPISIFGNAGQGVAATANFIKNNDPAILAALKSGNTSAFLAAVGGWASHGTSQKDVDAENAYAAKVASDLGATPVISKAIGSGGGAIGALDPNGLTVPANSILANLLPKPAQPSEAQELTSIGLTQNAKGQWVYQGPFQSDTAVYQALSGPITAAGGLAAAQLAPNAVLQAKAQVATTQQQIALAESTGYGTGPGKQNLQALQATKASQLQAVQAAQLQALQQQGSVQVAAAQALGAPYQAAQAQLTNDTQSLNLALSQAHEQYLALGPKFDLSTSYLTFLASDSTVLTAKAKQLSDEAAAFQAFQGGVAARLSLQTAQAYESPEKISAESVASSKYALKKYLEPRTRKVEEEKGSGVKSITLPGGFGGNVNTQTGQYLVENVVNAENARRDLYYSIAQANDQLVQAVAGPDANKAAEALIAQGQSQLAEAKAHNDKVQEAAAQGVVIQGQLAQIAAQVAQTQAAGSVKVAKATAAGSPFTAATTQDTVDWKVYQQQRAADITYFQKHRKVIGGTQAQYLASDTNLQGLHATALGQSAQVFSAFQQASQARQALSTAKAFENPQAIAAQGVGYAKSQLAEFLKLGGSDTSSTYKQLEANLVTAQHGVIDTASAVAQAQFGYYSALFAPDAVLSAQEQVNQYKAAYALAVKHHDAAGKANALAGEASAEQTKIQNEVSLVQAQGSVAVAQATATGQPYLAALVQQTVDTKAYNTLVQQETAQFNTMKAAQQKAVGGLAAWLSGNANVATAQATLVTDESNAQQALVSQTENIIQAQLLLGQITTTQAIAELYSNLQKVKGNQALTLQVESEIRQLQNSAGSQLSFNLPTTLVPTTLYQARLQEATLGGGGGAGNQYTFNFNVQGGNPNDWERGVNLALTKAGAPRSTKRFPGLT